MNLNFYKLIAHSSDVSSDRSLKEKNLHPTVLAPINPFVPNAPFLYPLKTSENRRERVHWEQMGSNKFFE